MNSYKIKKDFENILAWKFYFDIETMNFSNSEVSTVIFNRFGEQQTNNTIEDLNKPY